MDNKPPIITELNIFGNDGLRLTVQLSDADAKEFHRQVNNGRYEGQLILWTTGRFNFKTESEREEYFKNNPQ